MLSMVLTATRVSCLTESGKLDTRAAYGLHGREMMAWLTHLQHIREKECYFRGYLR